MTIIEWCIGAAILGILTVIIVPHMNAFVFVLLVAGLLIHLGFGLISTILALKKASGKEVLDRDDIKHLMWVLLGGVYSFYQYLCFRYKSNPNKKPLQFKNPFYKG